MKRLQRGLGLALTVCMTVAMLSGLGIVQVSAEEVSYTATYSDQKLAEEWTGTSSLFKNNGNWSYIWSTWGAPNAYLYYNKTMWADDFTYKARINNEGSTVGKRTTLYFCYQDADHYYAIHFYNDATNGVQFVKKEPDQAEQIIAQSANFVKPQGHNITITRNMMGVVTVAVADGKNNPLPDYFTNVVDKTYNFGYIGFGYNGDGGRFDGIVVTGSKKVWTPVYTEDFDDGGYGWAGMGDLGTDMTISGGQMGGTNYETSIMMYMIDGYAGDIRLAVDITARGKTTDNLAGILLGASTNVNVTGSYVVLLEGGSDARVRLLRKTSNIAWLSGKDNVSEVAKSDIVIPNVPSRLMVTYESGDLTVDVIQGDTIIREALRVEGLVLPNYYSVGICQSANDSWFDNFEASLKDTANIGPPPVASPNWASAYLDSFSSLSGNWVNTGSGGTAMEVNSGTLTSVVPTGGGSSTGVMLYKGEPYPGDVKVALDISARGYNSGNMAGIILGAGANLTNCYAIALGGGSNSFVSIYRKTNDNAWVDGSNNSTLLAMSSLNISNVKSRLIVTYLNGFITVDVVQGATTIRALTNIFVGPFSGSFVGVFQSNNYSNLDNFEVLRKDTSNTSSKPSWLKSLTFSRGLDKPVPIQSLQPGFIQNEMVIANLSDQPMSVLYLLVLTKNPNSSVVNIVAIPKTIAAYGEETFGGGFNVPSDFANYKLQVILWDSAAKMNVLYQEDLIS